MKSVSLLNRTELIALDPAIQRQLYLVPRGDSPRAQASSAARRREFADPVMKAKVLARLMSARTPASYLRVHGPEGKWIKTKNPKAENLKRAHRDQRRKKNIGRASAARFADPAFRARSLAQLAQAREKEMERRRLKREARP